MSGTNSNAAGGSSASAGGKRWDDIFVRLGVGRPFTWGWMPDNIGVGVGFGVGVGSLAIGPGVGIGFSLRDGTVSYGAGVRYGLALGSAVSMGKMKFAGMPVVGGMVIGPAMGIGREIPGLALTYDREAAFRLPTPPPALHSSGPNTPQVPRP